MADSEQKEGGSWWDQAKAAWAASNPAGDMVSKAVHWGEGAVKSGVDSWEATTAGWGQSMADATAGIPVVEQAGAAAGWVTKNYVGEYAGGFTKAAAGMVGGLANAVAHPADTALALNGMAEHIPIVGTIGKAGHAAFDYAVGDVSGEDAMKRMSPTDDLEYWKNVGKGLIKPMAESWEQGKYGDAVGQVACNVAALALGAGEAGAAGKAATVAGEGAEAATAARAAGMAADGVEAANAMRGATVAADGAEAATAARTASKVAEGAEATEGANAARGASNAAKGTEGTEAANGARAAEEAEAAAGATKKPKIPEADPEVTWHENEPGPYHEPPEDLMRTPEPKPEGMTDAAYENYQKGVENYNKSVEQNAQIPTGREMQNQARELGTPAEPQVAEVPGEHGHYDPASKQTKVNVTKDGAPASPEEIGTTSNHETTHALQDAQATYEAPFEAGEQAAGERVITREQEAAAAEARTAQEQLERIARDGELYPPEKVVGPDGTVDYVGEYERWNEAAEGVPDAQKVREMYQPDAAEARATYRENAASQAASDAELEKYLAELEGQSAP